MGERKGQNHYYPPDYDPKKGSLNKWQGVHALRERANKIHLGILIVSIISRLWSYFRVVNVLTAIFTSR
jgi:hypothetical protein